MSDVKRLFFGFEVEAPWPESFPSGRIINEANRHITLAFLGNVSFAKLQPLLNAMPLIPFQIGAVGICDKCLILPPNHPHVVAWHVHWLSQEQEIHDFQKSLIHLLKQYQFDIDDREFLSHVTLCRSPFNEKEWKKAFEPLPCFIKGMHLYESKWNLIYEPLWSHSLQVPFEEKEHTADIAFLIYGTTLEEIYINAQIALTFRFPPLLQFLGKPERIDSFETVIIRLNELVSKADAEMSCPFKAISFHGKLQKRDSILYWEMIVDV